MWIMGSRTWLGALLVGFVLSAAAACGDDDGEDDVPLAMTGSVRPGGTARDACSSGAGGPTVRVDGGGAQDASALDGGLDGGLDASLDASLLDGAVSDAMPLPMPVEDARAGSGGFGGVGGFGGSGGTGGAAAVGGF